MAMDTISQLYCTLNTTIVLLLLLQHALTYTLVQQNGKVNITRNINSFHGVGDVGNSDCTMEGICSRICHCLTYEDAKEGSVSCSNVPKYVDGNRFFGCLDNDHTQRLYIWNSNIDTIRDSEMEGIPHLTIFKMENSPLSSISETSFDGLDDLIELDFKNISLAVKKGTAPFSKLNKLISLSITHNSVAIKTVYCGYFYSGNSLEYLDLSHNQILEIDGCIFNKTNTLKVLIMSHNEIWKLTGETFQNLLNVVKIDLTSNLISKVDVQTFLQLSNLHELNLYNNSLKDRHDMKVTSALKVFNVSKNLLEGAKGSIKLAADIEILDLDKNNFQKIVEFYFSGLPFLQILHCSYMPHLTLIETNAFANISQLKILYLFNNSQLKTISPDSFPTIPFLYLERIYIHNNALKMLSSGLFLSHSYFPALKIVEAHGNPYNCSCDVALMRQAMDDNTIPYVQPWKSGDTALICEYPVNSAFSGEKIYKFEIEQFVCESPLLENRSNHCSGEVYSFQVNFSIGLPNVKWKPLPNSPMSCDNKSFSFNVEINDNYTISTFTIHNPSYQCNGKYIAQAVNAVPKETIVSFVTHFNRTVNPCVTGNKWKLPVISSVSSFGSLMIIIVLGILGILAWKRNRRPVPPVPPGPGGPGGGGAGGGGDGGAIDGGLDGGGSAAGGLGDGGLADGVPGDVGQVNGGNMDAESDGGLDDDERRPLLNASINTGSGYDSGELFHSIDSSNMSLNNDVHTHDKETSTDLIESAPSSTGEDNTEDQMLPSTTQSVNSVPSDDNHGIKYQTYVNTPRVLKSDVRPKVNVEGNTGDHLKLFKSDDDKSGTLKNTNSAEVVNPQSKRADTIAVQHRKTSNAITTDKPRKDKNSADSEEQYIQKQCQIPNNDDFIRPSSSENNPQDSLLKPDERESNQQESGIGNSEKVPNELGKRIDKRDPRKIIGSDIDQQVVKQALKKAMEGQPPVPGNGKR